MVTDNDRRGMFQPRRTNIENKETMALWMSSNRQPVSNSQAELLCDAVMRRANLSAQSISAD